jgi:hypothetical protein
MNHNCDARRLGINSHGRWAEREVAARMRKTGNVALCQRVGIDRRSDHRDRAGCSNGGLDKLILAADEEHVDTIPSHLAHRRRQAVKIIALDVIDRHVAAFDIAELAQPILEGDALGT